MAESAMSLTLVVEAYFLVTLNVLLVVLMSIVLVQLSLHLRFLLHKKIVILKDELAMSLTLVVTLLIFLFFIFEKKFTAFIIITQYITN